MKASPKPFIPARGGNGPVPGNRPAKPAWAAGYKERAWKYAGT